jgi:4'-phosphopantetheinyl transferase
MLPALHPEDGEVLERLSALLSDDELLRASSFHRLVHRSAFIANRARLRAVLSHYLDCDPGAIRFSYGPQGKPDLADDSGTGLSFNLSHTDGLAVLAISCHRQIGVDIEPMKAATDLLDLARGTFSANEYQQMTRLSGPGQVAAFYACWTRKEAFLKGLGTGLAQDLAGFEVSLLPGEPARVVACEWSPELCQSWRLHTFDPGDGYAGALAYERTPHEPRLGLKTFTWSDLESPA